MEAVRRWDLAGNDMGWLGQFEQRDGVALISENRPYQHDETAYDSQYRINEYDESGAGIVNVLKRLNADFGGPILELGCGTGRASVGLCKAAPNPWMLITDASTTFIDITRRKMQNNHVDLGRVRFAVLADTDLGRLPAEAVSAIILRSVLHHFLDVPAWIHNAARLLRPGGVIAVAEPFSSGYILMGIISQAVAGAQDNGLNPQQRARVQLMADTMKAYNRRDQDKSEWEDKHLFRPDEMMTWAQDIGLNFSFMPNATFEGFAAGTDFVPEPVNFAHFYRNYLNYCMGFGADDAAAITAAADPLFSYLAEANSATPEPYLMSLFAFQKPHRR